MSFTTDSLTNKIKLALILMVLVLLVACGNEGTGLSTAEVQEVARAEVLAASASQQSEPGLTRQEVDQIVQAAVDALPDPPPELTAADVEQTFRNRIALADLPLPESGLSRSEVEEIVSAALADIPRQEAGLTSDEAERIARGVVASIPPRSAPAEYTKFFVDNAISRYETQGLNATLAYYNRGGSVDGQWYVFIIDENDLVVAHPDPSRLGLDLKGWVGTDANGYNFGPEMLSATEAGKWVSYVYRNPEKAVVSTGDLSNVDLKNAWVVRHNGLLFASGWYIDVDQFTIDIVTAVVDLFHSQGLAGLVETLGSNPGSILGGVAESAVSYNASGTVEGEWSLFIADESGTIVLHFNPAMIGKGLEDLLGPGALDVDENGGWLTSEFMRIWMVKSEGWMFGAGWRNDQSGS